tara:strand:- start:792 stop:1436 length:645 start_codon:yes stop_codon:yes gene_type:complete
MTRKPLDKDDEATVLTMSRRRCCICYGLNKDARLKKGQIAHLDKNSANNKLDNLAFLCFDHHDLYDSTSSQSKNLTKKEVMTYRKELHEAIAEEWKKPIQIGFSTLKTGIEGHYIRETEHENSELTITKIDANQYQIDGFTIWGLSNPNGPNSGSLEFRASLDNNTLRFEDQLENDNYTLELKITGDQINASEENVPGYFGLNASFNGEYKRVK